VRALVEPLAAETDHFRVLIVDDNAFDAELCRRALKRAGIRLESLTVEDEPQLRSALQSFVPDVVLCDFSMPNFDGFAAHAIVHAALPDCPLIFVSGAISEERAAMALQCGAVDYVMKSALVRLPLAVERAVRAARAASAVADRARRHVKRLEVLWGIVNDPDVRGAELVRAMLVQAANDLSAHQRFDAFLCEGSPPSVAVVDSTFDGAAPLSPEILSALDTLGNALPAGPARTRSWADVKDEADAPPALADAGWRAAISTAFESNGLRYCLTFAAPGAASSPFGDDDFAYLDVLASCFANQARVGALEASLRDEEERSRNHADRLEASWQIVNDTVLSDAERWLAMLSHAAASIWPGYGYRGTLWRIHGEEMTCEAIGEAPGHALTPAAIEVGTTIPVASSAVGLTIQADMKSRSWDDLQASEPQLKSTRSGDIRSAIVTTFQAGGSTWALSFASGRLTGKPLGNLDHAYLDVLASYFASHVERRWQDERYRFEREHDVLTGLLNRSQFRSQADAASPAGTSYALATFDVSAFHEINESYGHSMGDAVLVDVANVLLEIARSDEIVGRLGGDLFAVYLANRSPGYVRGRVLDFAAAFARPFAPAGTGGKAAMIVRTARIGVAIAPDDGNDIDTLISRSGAALAIAKGREPGAIVYYETSMERDARVRITLRSELVEALAQDQFTLYYQPHVELGTGRVTGCEALIRWNHPTRGVVAPFHFIPFAEETGFITSIDAWVMRHAFEAAARFGASRPDFRLYFNLSGRQASTLSIVREFVRAARAGVPLKNVGVEITETDAMRNVAATRRVLRALRRLNVRTAMDDFGMGYSSLSSLKQLPVDIVKIDRSFVSGVTSNRDDAAMAETIISIAEHFEFESLGEGAETQAEIEWLRNHSCRYVQGYGICHPLPLEAFEAWLADYDANLHTHLPRDRRVSGPDRRRVDRRKPANGS
jgi:diguanylate cyclase (GGDEF)-like protein